MATKVTTLWRTPCLQFVFLLSLFSACVSCRSTPSREPAPWELTEPEDLESDSPSWAPEGVRVVYHYKEEAEVTFHNPRWQPFLGWRRLLLDDEMMTQIEVALEFGPLLIEEGDYEVITGFIGFSEPLIAGDRTLHMFECGLNTGLVYAVENYVVQCDLVRTFALIFPVVDGRVPFGGSITIPEDYGAWWDATLAALENSHPIEDLWASGAPEISLLIQPHGSSAPAEVRMSVLARPGSHGYPNPLVPRVLMYKPTGTTPEQWRR